MPAKLFNMVLKSPDDNMYSAQVMYTFFSKNPNMSQSLYVHCNQKSQY